MIKLELISPIVPEVEISGEKFTVLLGEIDIQKMLEAVQESAKALESNGDPEKVLEYLHGINNAIDAIIGEGAFAKLAAGRSINAVTAMRWLAAVAEAALEANVEAVKQIND